MPLLLPLLLAAQTVTVPQQTVTIPAKTLPAIRLAVAKNGTITIPAQVIPASSIVLPAQALPVTIQATRYDFSCSGTPATDAKGNVTISNLVCTAVKK